MFTPTDYILNHKNDVLKQKKLLKLHICWSLTIRTPRELLKVLQSENMRGCFCAVLITCKWHKLFLATSKTWTRTLDPDTGLWTLDPVPGSGPWTRTLKNLDLEKPGPWKTWTLKNLGSEKPGINIGLKNMSDFFMELCFTKTIRNVSYCLKVRVLTDMWTKSFRLNYSAVTWSPWNLRFCSSNIACRHMFN